MKKDGSIVRVKGEGESDQISISIPYNQDILLERFPNAKNITLEMQIYDE